MADDREKILVEIDAEDNASRRIDQVSKSVENLGKSGSGLSSASNGISGFVSSIESGISRVNNVTRQYNNAMRGLNTAVINVVKDMGAAVYDFTTDSIDNFTKFSEQHARTLGAMAADYDNTSAAQQRFFEDAGKLKEQAFQIGTYGVNGTGSLSSIVEVSEVQESLVKAGIDPNTIINTDALKDVLTFAQANELDSDTAVSTAVTLGNQFDIDPKDWGLMLDKISHAADMSIVEVSDITQSLKWASGISSGLDRSFEETLGMITILGDFGLKGSQAGTGIQALLTRLLTGDTTVITQAQAEVAPGNALEKFYEFEKIAKPDGNLLPMNDVITEMNTIMEDMTDEEQAWFAKKLFGLYQMKSAYALMNGDDVDLNDLIKEIETMSEGTNENKLQQLLDSQYGQLTSLNNLWEGVKTDVGDRLSPFVDAVRDELFNFLSNDGHYNINFDNLRDALDESCDLIEEKYGSAVANAVRGLGDFTIDLTQVMTEIAPELGSGMLEFFGSLFSGDVFGEGGAISDWDTMIENMKTSVDGLPEDLQGLGDAVVGCIDWFGKLMALNVASTIAELISSVLQILTIAGGAVINVAGAVVVNGTTVGSAAGTSHTTYGAGAGAGVTGKSVVGSADDVARALGTTSDDVISTFGKQATYSVDDLAKGLGTSTDDIISGLGLASKSASTISKFGKGLGALGIGLEVVSTGFSAYDKFSNNDDKGGVEEIGGGIGSIGGGLGGAKLGAAIGTAIAPGIGTAIGVILGAIGGSFAGDFIGEKAGGVVYDVANPGEQTDEYQRLTTTGEKYKKKLAELKKQYDELAASGNDNTIEAYKLKNSIDELTASFNSMGDTTIAGLIEKSEQLKTVIDGINEVQEQTVNEAESTADQSKSYIATLDSLPEVKDDNQKTIAQGIIDKLNEQYNMGIEMDETGKYNMTTGDMWDKVNQSTDQVKTDANMEALLGYLTQYQQAQSRYDEANKTKTEAYEEYEYAKENIFPEEHPFLAWTGWAGGAEMNWGGTTKERFEEYQAAQEAVNNTASEFNTLDEKIRSCYEAMGYMPEEIDKMMADLALSSAKATEEERNLGEDDLLLNPTSVILNVNDMSMPDIWAKVREINPAGYAAWSDKGAKDFITNQIQIDDSVTMTPSFAVSAPNVNVNVKVDQAGNITRNTSILNPGYGSLLNNWYSRTSSQYGNTTK